jgi:hypothetical protein
MIRDATLKNSEKANVFAWVNESGFDPSSFEWTEETSSESQYAGSPDYRVSAIRHRHSDAYFVFGAVYLGYSPAPNRKSVDIRHDDSWAAKQTHFRLWLRELRRELETPDPWATVMQDRDFLQLAGILQSENTPFTRTEQEYISLRLGEIRDALIASVLLTTEQRQLIEVQIQYAAKAAERLGRIDWKGVLVNTLITIAVSAVFAPDRTRELFHAAAAAFMPLYQAVHGVLH